MIASSAGYPDDKPRKTLPFPVFATAGTEDFNHLELRRLDRALTSPHRLAVFEGGHVWLSSDLAIEAVEWMELQAMKSGLKPRDEREIDRLFARRVAAAGQPRTDLARYLSLRAIVEDFDGVRDVKALPRSRRRSRATNPSAPRSRRATTRMTAKSGCCTTSGSWRGSWRRAMTAPRCSPTSAGGGRPHRMPRRSRRIRPSAASRAAC